MKVQHALCSSALALATLLGSASAASAANTTCADREAMLVGSTENWSIGAGASAYFATRLFAGRSYAFLVWTPFEDAGEGGGTVTLTIYSDTACTTTATTSDIETREPWGNIASADVDGRAFVPATTGEYVLRVANGEARSVSHRIMVIETTLYSPWWYVGSPNQSFITVANTLSTHSVTPTITIRGTNGTTCGTATPTIPANGNVFIRVNDYPSCVSAGYGQAHISFLATPGAIVANTTVIDSVGGVSFDEPFTPRAVWGYSVTER